MTHSNSEKCPNPSPKTLPESSVPSVFAAVSSVAVARADRAISPITASGEKAVDCGSAMCGADLASVRAACEARQREEREIANAWEEWRNLVAIVRKASHE